MNIEQLILTHGYWVLALGVLAEGETILVLAGFAAQRGYLHLPWIILIAALCTLVEDQAFFHLGRRKGKAFLKNRPAWKAKASVVLRKLAFHRYAVVLGFRFLYGLRTISPFVIGMSPIPSWQFLALNVVSAGIWATSFCLLGYLFGTAMEAVLGKIHQYEAAMAVGLALAGLVIWGVHAASERRRKRRESAADCSDNRG